MRFHCTALAGAVLFATVATGMAQPAQPAPGEAAFAIYLHGTQIGREQWTLAKGDFGWMITSNGRSAPPLDFTINRFEMKYGPDWQPLEMHLEAHARNVIVRINTSFTMTTAINEILQGNTAGGRTDQVSARTIVLPNNIFASYEALAARLWTAPSGAELPVYVAPVVEIKVKVGTITNETLTGPGGSLATKRFDLVLQNPERPVNAVAVVDEHLRLVRVEVPEIGLQAIREDVSSVAVRAQAARNPTDADVSIPANGFDLAGTLTTPPVVAGRLRYPAVVLVGGLSPADRDETIGTVPVFAQLARALADSGHIVLRYDRRGTGQSGGRTDTATLSDYASDVMSAVKWLARREDVSDRQIVVVGHMDGGPVALLAAAAANKDIDGVATIDAAGVSGADLVLLQQQKLLDDTKLTDADKQARVDLQKKIQAAVLSSAGWEGVPEPLRRQADTPWFKSVLTYDPAKVLPKVRQPVLILHGDLDPTVPASEADKLGALARARKKAPKTDVVHLHDVGNSLAPAGSSQVTPAAAEALAAWIKKLL